MPYLRFFSLIAELALGIVVALCGLGLFWVAGVLFIMLSSGA